LSGGAIPDVAKIVGMCEAFDSMTSYRPYRHGMPRDKAFSKLNSKKDTQFDAHFSDIFVSIGQAGQLDHVLGHCDDGIPLQSCSMCGPTLVLRKVCKVRQKIYCRNYGGEFDIKEGDHCLITTPTGHQGCPANLEPKLDDELIKRTVIASVDAMSAMAPLATSSAYQASQ
jgi:hypothetical protein